MALMTEFYSLSPEVAGMADCESSPTHLKNKNKVAEKYLGRRFLSTQQIIEQAELENAYWPPVLENTADGTRTVASDMVPILRLLESGALHQGLSRPLDRVSSNDGAAG